MMTIRLANGRQANITSVSFSRTKELFEKSREGLRSSECCCNYGLIKLDGKPICQFSYNGRCWPTEEFEPGHWRSVFTSEELFDFPIE